MIILPGKFDLANEPCSREVERNISRIELNEESANHFDRSSVGR
jgi:hypothetical protein